VKEIMLKGWILYSDSTEEVYELDRIIDYGKEIGIELEVFEPSDFDIILNNEKGYMIIKGEKRELPDFFFPRMGASTTYFAFTIIREFERLGIPVVNSSISIDLVKDKLYSQQILSREGLPTPKTVLLKHPVNIDLIEKEIGFPCVIKNIIGSQGKGVFIANTKKEFESQMDILESVNDKANIIIQEFMKDSFGKDVRVYVVGGRPIAGMLRKAQDGEFKANISQGGSGTTFELTDEVKWLAMKACKVLNLDIGGVDLLFDGEHFRICEVNSNPGFKGFEKATNINIPEQIFSWLRMELGKF
jgi:gamma-F420-2:alpha-L-glutamate ligase